MDFVIHLTVESMANVEQWERLLSQLDLTTKSSDIEAVALHVKDVQLFLH